MANSLVTPTKIIKEVAAELVNNIRFAKKVNRSYDSAYSEGGAKVGYTVQARLPQRYQVTKGQALSITPVDDQVVPITVTDQAHVGLAFSSASLTMEVDDYKKRYIMPAVHALVNQMDYDGLSRMYKKVANVVGTPGTTPGSTGTLPAAANIVYLSAGVKLSETAVPDPRIAMLSPEMHAYLASANLTLFNPTGAISEMFRKGQFGGEALGVSKWFETQNIPIHTVGVLGGTPLLNGIPANGATTVVTNGWTAAVATRLLQGDVVQIAGVYEINPLSYQSTGRLKDWLITADTASDGSGNLTMPIYPAMYVSGNQQNCSGSPATNAIVTIFSHASSYASKVSPQGLIYQEDAFALVMADLEMPGGLWVSERIANKELGVSIRFLKAYSIETDQSPARLDILYGWAAIRPELACRVCAGPGA